VYQNIVFFKYSPAHICSLRCVDRCLKLYKISSVGFFGFFVPRATVEFYVKNLKNLVCSDLSRI
jgi:hypothetical protein